MISSSRVTRLLIVGTMFILAFLVNMVGARATGTWTLTGSLNVGRINFPHQTFLVSLDDGQILAVAGVDNSGGNGLNSAELYNPSTGSWDFTIGLLGDHRFFHTSTKLLDGNVLVAGGQDLSSAELYDPITETFSPTNSSLGTRRSRHTATLLSNGKALIAGGQDSLLGVIQNSAELYDPVSKTFAFTSSMGTPRQEFTATLLLNGKVLIVAGQVQVCAPPACVTTSAELYDPDTETFSSTGSLGTRRSLHTATLLQDGTVLIVGGTTTAPGPTTATATAEIYDPLTETFSPTGNLITARREHTATLMPDGKVLIAGGFGAGDVILTSVEIYNPATGMFSAAASMNVSRATHGAVLLQNGQVLVAGGRTSAGGNTNSAELFSSVTFVFTGFFPPVDNPPTVNSVKAGSAIPVKFSLNGDQGLNIFAEGYPASQPITCDSSLPFDEIETTVTAGSSSFSYDAANDEYNYPNFRN